jgi:NADH-quinone oxidoreductase subunit C/D
MSDFHSYLKQEFRDGLSGEGDKLQLKLDTSRLSLIAGDLKHKYGFIFLSDIIAVDHQGLSGSDSRFQLIYQLINLEEFCHLSVKVELAEGTKVNSVSSIWPAARRLEIEARDMLGIQFETNLGVGFLNPEDFGGNPLRKDFSPNVKEEVLALPTSFPADPNIDADQKGVRSWVNIGPHHPVMKNKIRMILELEGEYIRRSQYETGFYHRGFEKQAEKFDWSTMTTLIERLNPEIPFLATTAWCHLVETSMNQVIPERAMAIRMVLMELSRIQDHLECVSSCAVAAGNESVYFICQQSRELVYELFERMTGSRVNPSLNLIGGVKYDVPIGWITDCFEALKKIEEHLVHIDTLFTRSSIWLDRNMVSELKAGRTLELGITGPILRSCGVNFDLRKVQPIYFYSDVEFEIPLGVRGENYDRYLVRMEEIKQSISIVIQVLDNLPIGDIHHRPESIVMPKGTHSFNLESSNGLLGFSVVSDGHSNKPWRLKVRSPSFLNIVALPEMIENRMLDDALMAFSSLNINPGELDR